VKSFFVCGEKVFSTVDEAKEHAAYWKTQNLELPVYEAKVVGVRLN
jgi:hypothetical protein